MKTTSDFSIGQEVIYVPNHASGVDDRACEHGRVSSINDIYVFVKFDPAIASSKGCHPRNLQHKCERQ